MVKIVFIFKPFFVSCPDVGQMCRWSNGDVPWSGLGTFKQRVERRRENIDAQAASTDGRATLYANGQTHMFGRKKM